MEDAQSMWLEAGWGGEGGGDAHSSLLNILSISDSPASLVMSLSSLDLLDLHFQSLEVVSRYRDSQLQMTETTRIRNNI